MASGPQYGRGSHSVSGIGNRSVFSMTWAGSADTYSILRWIAVIIHLEDTARTLSSLCCPPHLRSPHRPKSKFIDCESSPIVRNLLVACHLLFRSGLAVRRPSCSRQRVVLVILPSLSVSSTATVHRSQPRAGLTPTSRTCAVSTAVQNHVCVCSCLENIRTSPNSEIRRRA